MFHEKVLEDNEWYFVNECMYWNDSSSTKEKVVYVITSICEGRNNCKKITFRPEDDDESKATHHTNNCKSIVAGRLAYIHDKYMKLNSKSSTIRLAPKIRDLITHIGKQVKLKLKLRKKYCDKVKCAASKILYWENIKIDTIKAKEQNLKHKIENCDKNIYACKLRKEIAVEELAAMNNWYKFSGDFTSIEMVRTYFEEQYNISVARATMFNWIKASVEGSCVKPKGRPPVLSNESEINLLNCIIELAKLGTSGLDEDYICSLAGDMISDEILKAKFVDGEPGRKWFVNWYRRMEKLTPRLVQTLQKIVTRAKDEALNSERINWWYDSTIKNLDDLGAIERNNNFHVNDPIPEHAYTGEITFKFLQRVLNLDETCISGGQERTGKEKNKKVVTLKNLTSDGKSYVSSTDYNNHITMLAGPVYNGDNAWVGFVVDSNPVQKKLKSDLETVSNTWWQDLRKVNNRQCNELFIEYSKKGSVTKENIVPLLSGMIKHMYPDVSNASPDKRVHIFLDLHSSRTDYANLLKLQSLGIHLHSLILNSTKDTQPADVGIYSGLKRKMTRLKKQTRRNRGGISATDRITIAVEALSTSATIKANLLALKQSGMVPFDRRVLLIKPQVVLNDEKLNQSKDELSRRVLQALHYPTHGLSSTNPPASSCTNPYESSANSKMFVNTHTDTSGSTPYVPDTPLSDSVSSNFDSVSVVESYISGARKKGLDMSETHLWYQKTKSKLEVETKRQVVRDEVVKVKSQCLQEKQEYYTLYETEVAEIETRRAEIDKKRAEIEVEIESRRAEMDKQRAEIEVQIDKQRVEMDKQRTEMEMKHITYQTKAKAEFEKFNHEIQLMETCDEKLGDELIDELSIAVIEQQLLTIERGKKNISGPPLKRKILFIEEEGITNSPLKRVIQERHSLIHQQTTTTTAGRFNRYAGGTLHRLAGPGLTTDAMLNTLKGYDDADSRKSEKAGKRKQSILVKAQQQYQNEMPAIVDKMKAWANGTERISNTVVIKKWLRYKSKEQVAALKSYPESYKDALKGCAEEVRMKALLLAKLDYCINNINNSVTE